MIAKRSVLKLESFSILDSKCSIVLPNEPIEFQPIADTETFPVEIDFRLEKENDVERYRIFVSLEINNCTDKKNGYSIAVSGMGFFSIDETEQIEEKDKIQLLESSGLSICITNLRSYITNQTSYYPWGSFTFHAIDVHALLKEKKEQEEKEEK